MWTLNNQCFLFVAASSGIFLMGYTINIDLYENNQLIHLTNNSYSKIVMSTKSLKQLNLKQNSWFKYYKSGVELNKKVLNIETQGDISVVVLQKEANSFPITNISYKIGKTNIWSGIFS